MKKQLINVAIALPILLFSLTSCEKYGCFKGDGTVNTELKISGSGNIKVYATDNLLVKITGSGNVYYKSNPTVDVKITGSGDVMKF